MSYTNSTHKLKEPPFWAPQSISPTAEQLEDFNKNIHSSNNVLLSYSTKILILLSYLFQSDKTTEVQNLHQLIINELKHFQQSLEEINYPAPVLLATHYCLCTAIDESVLKHEWGSKSIWSQQSMLSIFHKETWGGERFYLILESFEKESHRYLDFLELAYLILSIGYEGKYYGENSAIKEAIRKRIFLHIEDRHKNPYFLFQNDNEQEKPKNFLKRISLSLCLLLTTFILISLEFAILNIKLNNQAIHSLAFYKSRVLPSPALFFSRIKANEFK